MNTELMIKTKVIKEELETRKLVERAKEVLMNRHNKTGEEAYQWIKNRSMDTRKSMRPWLKQYCFQKNLNETFRLLLVLFT